MPTYEYSCRTCNHRFETWQKMADEPLTICPECGGHIRRVFFPTGIVFKGSGFYKTDNAAKSAASENGSSVKSESAKPADTGSETKTSSESKSPESGASSSSDTTSAKTSESKVAAEAK